MPEEKRKINCWIPVSLYDKIEPAGYESVTQAVIEGLQRILEDTSRIQKGSNENILGYVEDIEGSSQDTVAYLKDVEVINTENLQLKEALARLEKDILGYKQDTEGSKKDLERIQEGYNKDITGYKENIKALNVEIARLKEALSNAPDPSELIEARTRSEGLQRLTEEKERTIDILNREVETLNVFAHYFKNVEIKQIEAPSAEKKRPWWQFW